MTNRFLFALIVLLSLAEATVPAGAFPVATKLLDMQSTDTSGAFIRVKKARDMATERNASSGTIATEPTAFHVIANIHTACAATTAIKGSTQALVVATKTSPMAKTELW
jgi:hypothetical protein